jgi:hypothetical protein
MILMRRVLRSLPVRRIVQPIAVVLVALAIGALPLAGGATAEASSAGDAHDGVECSGGYGDI